jgi:hypothetical protein
MALPSRSSPLDNVARRRPRDAGYGVAAFARRFAASEGWWT